MPDQNTSPPSSRKGRILWIAGFVFACAWMFSLGVLVGRGTAPVRFDIQKLQKDLAALKEAMLQEERRRFKIQADADQHHAEMEFYDRLPETESAPGGKRRPDDQRVMQPPRPMAAADPKTSEVQPALPVVKDQPPVDQKATADTVQGRPTAGQKATNNAVKDQPPADKKTTNTTAKDQASADQKITNDAVPPDIKERLTIQVASLKDSQVAERMVADLKSRWYPAYRVTAHIPGMGVYYRVRIGSFGSKEEAQSILERLKKEKVKAILVHW